MSKKNKPDTNGFVFSTDPNFRFKEEPAEVQETLAPNQQKLKVRLDTKQRAGKAVTLVQNFYRKRRRP
jgi:translation initiation factor 1